MSIGYNNNNILQNQMAFSVRLISAQLTHDTQTFSNMDPYCYLQLGNERKRSKTLQQGGKRPVWNQQFFFPASNVNTMIVTVMDQDMVTDDVVGKGTINILNLRNSPNSSEQVVQLMYEGRNAGQVRLSFRSTGTSTYNNAYNPYQQGQQFQYQQQPMFNNMQPQQPLYPPLNPPVDLSNNGWGNFQPGSNYIPPPNNSYGQNQQYGQGQQQFGMNQQYGMNQQSYGMNQQPYGQNQYQQYPQSNPNSVDYKLVQGMQGLFAQQANNNNWQNQNQNNPYGKNNGW